MKHRILVFLVALSLLIGIFLPVSAEDGIGFSDYATSQTFYSLIAYSRMCNGKSPLYVLDNGAGRKSGYQRNGVVNQVQGLIDGIVLYKSGNTSLQGWIDSGLVRDVKKGAEWYAIAISQNGKYDFSPYEKVLLQFLNENPPGALQTAQKFAITLIAIGSNNSFIQEVADRSTSSAPVMAQIFGLHLLNNGIVSNSYTQDDVKSKLLDMQRKDGGWAVMGQYGDVDVTCMVLQALAPHSNEPVIKSAIDRAVAFLSARQNPDGSFSSMGKVNCESTAQVVAALSDLRIDCANDSRFIKNGKSPIDGLKTFRLADGSFSHFAPQNSDADEKYNSSSSQSQEPSNETSPSAGNNVSVMSPNASEKMSPAKDEVISDGEPEQTGNSDSESNGVKDTEHKTSFNSTEKKSRAPKKYKWIVSIVMLIIFSGLIILLAVIKKATRKNILLICFFFIASLIVIYSTDFESVNTHSRVEEKSNVIGNVSLSIRCDTVAGRGNSEFIPPDGCILDTTGFEIEPGNTVYDVLEEATKRFNIHMDKKGGDGFIYISAIGHLYELQFGEMSGWVYHVNGNSPSVGCDNYIVSDGDIIEWMYTLDLGADVGNTFETEDEN